MGNGKKSFNGGIQKMIDTVINYCTVDFKFLEKSITECLKFSNQIIIPVCDHFLDGTSEDTELLIKTYELQKISPKISFISYEWDSEKNAKYHHNMSRFIGHTFTTSDYILFLDADELINGSLMKEYLSLNEHIHYDAVAFKCYWYFREPIYRAKTTEMAGVLYNKRLCSEPMFFHQEERWAYRYMQNVRVKEEETLNGQIMCNHYSWVRTKEEMLRKVTSWAHSNDTNWTALVEEEFSREFNGTDFVHGYQYDILEKTT